MIDALLLVCVYLSNLTLIFVGENFKICSVISGIWLVHDVVTVFLGFTCKVKLFMLIVEANS